MTDRPVFAVDTPGVKHYAADLRRKEYRDSGGESGLVVAGGGGLVPTPGDSTKVRILPCSPSAVSRYPGHSRQSYGWEVPTAVDVQLRPAPSTGGRTDAIILRVRDYAVEGTTVTDPNAVPYWEPEVLEGVPSSTGYTQKGIAAWKGIKYPFVLIGVVNMPKGSSAVGNIDPLMNPIKQRKDYVQVLWGQPSVSEIGPIASFRDIGEKVYFNVPEWAGTALVTATVQQAYCRSGSSAGWLSGLTMGQSLEQVRWDIDVPTGGYVRGTYVVAGNVDVSAARRGTVQDFQLRATNELDGSAFGLNSGSSILLRVDFAENINMDW